MCGAGRSAQVRARSKQRSVSVTAGAGAVPAVLAAVQLMAALFCSFVIFPQHSPVKVICVSLL